MVVLNWPRLNPLQLLGTTSVLARINGKSDLVTVETNKSGKKNVNGNAKRLRESAHYPLGFGLALAQLIKPHGAPAPSVDWFEGQNYFFLDCIIVNSYHLVTIAILYIHVSSYIYNKVFI